MSVEKIVITASGEQEIEIRKKVAEAYANAVKEGEIKKPDVEKIREIIAGYLVDDDGNPVVVDEMKATTRHLIDDNGNLKDSGLRFMTLGYLVDDNGNRVGSENN